MGVKYSVFDSEACFVFLFIVAIDYAQGPEFIKFKMGLIPTSP